jgi:hypothetical protein
MNFKIVLACSVIPCIVATILYSCVASFSYPFPDSYGYLVLGNHLAQTGEFGSREEYDLEKLAYLRTPGYPLCIALFSWAGRHGFFIANLLFLLGITYFTLALAAHWHNKHIGLLTGFLATCPGLLVCTTVPLTEICFCFWFVAAVYYFAMHKTIPTALALSCAALVKPLGSLLFVPFAIGLIWKRQRIATVLVFILLANLLPLGWSLRNYARTGHFFYTTIGGYNLLYYKAGTFLAYKNNEPFIQTCARLQAGLPHPDNPILQTQAAQSLGLKIMRENGWQVWFCLLRNLPYFWLPDITPLLERLQISQGNKGTYDILWREGVWRACQHYFAGNRLAGSLTAIYGVYYGILLLAVAYGLWYLYRQRQIEELLTVIVFTGYFSFMPLGNLDWRFRLAMMPIYFIVIGIAWRKPPARIWCCLQ